MEIAQREIILSIKNWDLGVQLQDALDKASDCKTYITVHHCPICGGHRTSKLHRSRNGQCAKIMKQKIDNANNIT